MIACGRGIRTTLAAVNLVGLMFAWTTRERAEFRRQQTRHSNRHSTSTYKYIAFQITEMSCYERPPVSTALDWILVT